MPFSQYQQLAQQVERAKEQAVDELLARLAANHPFSAPAPALPQSRFLRLLAFSGLRHWSVRDKLEQKENEYLANVAYVLRHSQNLEVTLRKILQYGNIKSRKGQTPQYYRKVPAADLAVIAAFLKE